MEWRDIPGFEGHYKVSECGEVLSCERTVPSRRHVSGTKRLPRRILKHQDHGGFIENRQRKAVQADEMFSNLISEMNNAMAVSTAKRFDATMEVPSWAM